MQPLSVFNLRILTIGKPKKIYALFVAIMSGKYSRSCSDTLSDHCEVMNSTIGSSYALPYIQSLFAIS